MIGFIRHTITTKLLVGLVGLMLLLSGVYWMLRQPTLTAEVFGSMIIVVGLQFALWSLGVRSAFLDNIIAPDYTPSVAKLAEAALVRDVQRDLPLSDDERLRDQIRFVGIGVNILLLLGLLLLASSQGWGYWQLPVLLALGLFSAGALVGFLFGIPKVASSANAVDSSIAIEPRDGPRRILNVNTNLEDVSDWLTKIIVGLGLIELRSIPAAVSSFARATGSAFHSAGDIAPIAVVIYFPVLGFTSGYLLTRIYVSALIGRADIQLDKFREKKQVVTKLVAAATEASSAKVGGEATAHEQAAEAKDTVDRIVTPQSLGSFQSGSILWVDDVPANNTDLIDAFRALGISVDLSLSTEDALAKIDGGQRYDAIITDMGRVGDARAGYTLLEALRKRGNRVPVLIAARGGSLEENRNQAKAAGAFDSTNQVRRVFEFVAHAVGGRGVIVRP